MSVSEPGKIVTPWAESGLKNPIPPAANQATGRAGFDQGFSAINMTAKEAGGIPPFGQDFNGIFYEVTNILRYMQAGGQPTFDATLATAIGGYPLGAVLIGDDGVSVFQNAVAGNETNPNAGGDGWARPDLQIMELYRRSYAEAGYNLLGTFRLGVTLNTATDAILDESTGIVYSWGGVLPHTVAPGTDPTEVGSGYVARTDVVLRGQLSGNWAEGGGELSVNITEPFGAGDYRLKWQKSRAALRGGLRDPLPLDDGKDHFRGLPNKDTWADPAMQGIGSFATGRNGASFAYLSATFGHDCVVYGAAGLAGGAGSCAGNPDIPFDDGAFGYCSLAYGKNTLAMGRISNAMGQDCEARSLVSSVDGYASYAAPGLASHPNAYFPGAVDKGVVSEGKSARAYGWRCEAYGDHATSIGFNLKVYNSATAIGSSPNDATPATISVPGAVAFFAQSTIPGVVVIPEDGTKAKTGFNTAIPRERFESVINPGEKFAVRKTDVTGNGRFALQGTLIDDTSVDILSIEWNSPSTTVANGMAVVSINGIPSIEITETGVVNFLVGSLSINQNGQGVKLKSPDGLTTKILRLSNAGALELV